jgi:hypothetical protein
LRLNKIIAYLNVIEDVKAMIQLIKLVFFLVIYMHLYACFWWMLVKKEQSWVPYQDMETDDFYRIYRQSTSGKYFMSLNSSIQILLGGGIAPINFN